jgi:outer membrane biosynthesis protein TonB
MGSGRTGGIRQKERNVPQIIVAADRGAAFGEGAVTFRETVNVADFESQHFATQLVERIGWAVEDANQAEQTSASPEDLPRGRRPRQIADKSQPRQTPDESQPRQTPDESQPRQTPNKSQSRQTPDESQPRQTPDESQPRQTPDESQPRQIADESQPPQITEATAPQRHERVIVQSPA